MAEQGKMAEQEGEWISQGGEIEARAQGKTMSGHRFSAAAMGAWKCETRLETADVRVFEIDFEEGGERPYVRVTLDGEDEGVELSSMAEHDRTEIYAALKASALFWVESYLRECWEHGWSPFPENALAGWG